MVRGTKLDEHGGIGRTGSKDPNTYRRKMGKNK